MRWLERFREEVAMVTPLIGALATTDAGEARCRHVVCRGIEDDGALLITSDARSRKNRQLARNPAAEACFWLAEPRVQWRIAGRVTVDISGERRERIWQEQSDAVRALFAWPASGEPWAEASAFPQAVPADAEVPATFEVLVLHPREVDRLDLRPHPHDRTIWRAPSWRGVDVNP